MSENGIPGKIQWSGKTTTFPRKSMTVKITKSVFRQLDRSKWIGFVLKEDIMELRCQEILHW